MSPELQAQWEEKYKRLPTAFLLRLHNYNRTRGALAFRQEDYYRNNYMCVREMQRRGIPAS